MATLGATAGPPAPATAPEEPHVRTLPPPSDERPFRHDGCAVRVSAATTVGGVLVNATLVPDTALLVPGTAGAAEVLRETRAAAVDAARALLAAAPSRVVVVAPGACDRTRSGPFAPSLAAAGIDDAALGWVAPPRDTVATTPPARVDAPAAATALLLLAHAGWTGPVTLVEVAPPRVDVPAGAAPSPTVTGARSTVAPGAVSDRADALATSAAR